MRELMLGHRWATIVVGGLILPLTAWLVNGATIDLSNAIVFAFVWFACSWGMASGLRRASMREPRRERPSSSEQWRDAFRTLANYRLSSKAAGLAFGALIWLVSGGDLIAALFAVAGGIYSAYVIERRDLRSLRWWVAFIIVMLYAVGYLYAVLVNRPLAI
jgi:hypothetical protein